MITSIQLSQEDIKLIILDYYQRQGITKESVNFYEKVKENKDESEIYAIDQIVVEHHIAQADTI